MKTNKRIRCLFMTGLRCAGLIYGLWSVAIAQPAAPDLRAASPVITVRADHPTADIQPTMWGVFFEDINMGADGGIYAELVKNRSFEFSKPLMGWTILGKPATEGDFLVINRRQENTAN